jgi:hypothetical protein
MLGKILAGASVEQVACDWIKENEYLWSNWILPLENTPGKERRGKGEVRWRGWEGEACDRIMENKYLWLVRKPEEGGEGGDIGTKADFFSDYVSYASAAGIIIYIWTASIQALALLIILLYIWKRYFRIFVLPDDQLFFFLHVLRTSLRSLFYLIFFA